MLNPVAPGCIGRETGDVDRLIDRNIVHSEPDITSTAQILKKISSNLCCGHPGCSFRAS